MKPALPCSFGSRTVVVFALAALAAACGGGGGSDAAAPSGVADDGGSPSAPAPTPPASDGMACGEAAFRDTALRLVNEHRAAGANCGSAGSFGAAPAVAWSDTLTQAAWQHSADMAARNYFSHTSPEGGTLGARVTAAGYAWSSVAENIAAGQASASAVVAGWMASPGHCRNIMTAALREVGMACARNDASTYRRYYTLVLAAPR
jgi:uncharacterized protein YkwD